MDGPFEVLRIRASAKSFICATSKWRGVLKGVCVCVGVLLVSHKARQLYKMKMEKICSGHRQARNSTTAVIKFLLKAILQTLVVIIIITVIILNELLIEQGGRWPFK